MKADVQTKHPLWMYWSIREQAQSLRGSSFKRSAIGIESLRGVDLLGPSNQLWCTLLIPCTP